MERVVDIVEEIFKTSSALSLFENTTVLEIEYSRLQSIIQSLLSNVNIVYKHGKGIINAQDFQIQCLLEFEKLKTKLASQRKSAPKPKPINAGQAPPPTLSSVPSTASISSQKNRTFLGVDAILYPKEQQKSAGTHKKNRRQGIVQKEQAGNDYLDV